MRETQVKSKGYYDKRARPLSKLHVGKGKTWEPAKVVSQDGGIFRRNRKFFNKTGEKTGQQNPPNHETQNSHVLPKINTPCEPENLTNNSTRKA